MASTISRDMYASIKSLQFEKIWKSISVEIMPQLVKDEYYVVPYPQEATANQIFTVYDKFHASKMDKLLKKGRAYRYLGHFNDMVNMKKSLSTARNATFTVCESSVFGIPKDYKFETTEEGYKPKTNKSLTFEVTNTKKRWGYVDSIGKQQIQCSSKFSASLERIYVINEIFVADKMMVKATVDDEVETWNFDGPITLAFKFVKIKRGKNGYFAPADKFDTLPRWSDLEKVQWDKPKMKEKTEETKEFDSRF